jgi:hypothetical protein
LEGMEGHCSRNRDGVRIAVNRGAMPKLPG